MSQTVSTVSADVRETVKTLDHFLGDYHLAEAAVFMKRAYYQYDDDESGSY